MAIIPVAKPKNQLEAWGLTDFRPQSQNISIQDLNTLALALNVTNLGSSAELQEKIFLIVFENFKQRRFNLLEQYSFQLSYLRDKRGKTLLMQAVTEWEQDTVQQLIQYQVGIHDRDSEGNTSLHFAAKSGALHLLDLLIQHLPIQAINRENQTSLHAGIIAGQSQVVEILLGKGANPQTKCFYKGIQISALALAAMKGDIACFDTLMRSGHCKFIEKTTGLGTLLHIVITFHQISLLKHLFKQYPEESKQILNEVNDEALPPFNLAAKYGDIEALIILKDQGADIETKDDQGRRPLHQAVIGGQLEVLSWLLYLGCKISKADNAGQTAPALARQVSDRNPGSSLAQSIASRLENYALQKGAFEKPSWEVTVYENLIFHGGGSKGIAHLGGLKYLQSKNVLKAVRRLAGTSTGAITATFLAVGYNVEELEHILTSNNMQEFLDHPLSSRKLAEISGHQAIQALNIAYSSFKKNFSPLQLVQELWQSAGICSGESTLKWLEKTISEKTNIHNCTFKELREELVNKNKGRHLHTFAIRIGEQKEIIRFSSEDSKWDDLVIAHAIRASMSIPGVYVPHVLHFKDKSNGNVYPRPDLGSFVDGGMLYNFPIDAFDEKGYQQMEFFSEQDRRGIKFNRRTLGFSLRVLSDHHSLEVKPVETVGELLMSFGNLYYNAEELIRTTNPNNIERIVELEIPSDIGTLSFGIPSARRLEIIDAAFNKTKIRLEEKLKPVDSSFFFKLLTVQGKLNLPLTLDKFSGRVGLLKDLARACNFENWKPGQDRCLLHIHGPAGLGKSETAIAFANANLHSDKLSLVWYIRCENSLLYDEAYRLLAQALKIPLGNENTEQVVRKVHLYLENTKDDKPWLLILDNVEKIVSIPERGGIIVTTSRQEKLGFENPTLFPITSFSLQETREFLLQYLQPEKIDKLEYLHQELEGWPLLLSQVPPYLKDKPFAISDYLSQLKEIDPIFIKEENAKYPRSLGKAFAMTLKVIQESNPEAIKMLYYCTFLDPDQIDMELFQSWYQDKLLVWIKKTIDPLKNAGILKYIDQGRAFNLHRLWQMFLERKLKRQGQDKTEGQFLQTLILIKAIFNKFDRANPSTWKQGRMGILHLAKLRSFEMWKKLNAGQIFDLLNAAGIWLTQCKGLPAHAEEYLKEALRNSTPDLDRAACLNNIGTCYASLGKYQEAIENWKESLKIRREKLGEDHLDIAASLNNVGLYYFFQKKYAEALDYNQRALKIRRARSGNRHPNVAESLNNIGACYRIQENYTEALKHYEQAFEIWKINSSEEHPYMAAGLNNMGICYYELSNYEKALESYQRALAIFKVKLGKDHHYVAMSLNGMATYYFSQNNYNKSWKLHFKALEIRKKALGEKHPVIVKNLGKISMCESKLQKIHEITNIEDQGTNISEEPS